MIKNLSVNQLLFSDLLIKEPVDQVNEKLTTETEKRKVILTGSRGSGKSVILGRREIASLGTDTPAILTRFEAAGIFGTRDNKVFNKDIIEHYYEVVMAKKFLNYIKEYYPDLFAQKFTRIDADTTSRLLEVDKYINETCYNDFKLHRKLFSGESVSEIVSLFRKGTGAKQVTLMIDRFDWTHNSDPRVQNVLKNYFEMFEKVIITSDDPTIMKDKRLVDLDDKGFEVVDFGYSTDLATIKRIIEARFSLDEDAQQKKFPVEDISDEDYQQLIERCDGNISTMLDVVREAEILHRWEGKDFKMEKALDEACSEKVNGVKRFRKMCKPPKLHL